MGQLGVHCDRRKGVFRQGELLDQPDAVHHHIGLQGRQRPNHRVKIRRIHAGADTPRLLGGESSFQPLEIPGSGENFQVGPGGKDLKHLVPHHARAAKNKNAKFRRHRAASS